MEISSLQLMTYFLHIHIYWPLRINFPSNGWESWIPPTLLTVLTTLISESCLNESMSVFLRSKQSIFAFIFAWIAHSWECIWGPALCIACGSSGVLQHCFKGPGTRESWRFNAWDLLLSPWDTCWDFWLFDRHHLLLQSTGGTFNTETRDRGQENSKGCLATGKVN